MYSAHASASRICRVLSSLFFTSDSTEIMAYHDIGKSKWDALGAPYALEALQTVSPEQKQLWQSRIDE